MVVTRSRRKHLGATTDSVEYLQQNVKRPKLTNNDLSKNKHPKTANDSSKGESPMTSNGSLKKHDPNTGNGSSDNDKPKTGNRSSEPEDGPLDLGKNYLVRRGSDLWHSAEILSTKLNLKKQLEYFVHYNDTNKRLDEWVPRNRIIRARVDIEHCKQKDLNKITDPYWSDKIMTRNHKRKCDKVNYVQMSSEKVDPTTDELEKELENINKIKFIRMIQLGKYEIDTWYFSPFPKEYQKEPKIWICEYCLNYCKQEISMQDHMSQCDRRQPPGVEVYHNGTLSIWEVNPSDNKLYCQNLSLLAKLFIDHKTLFFDVEQFLFYVLCEVDEDGAHLVGYFSKEKDSPEYYNVACILIIPPFQKKGYGKLLMAFSYELSKLEGLVASPEKPLSDLGKLSYQSYWSWVLLEILQNTRGTLSINELSAMTSITETDIISTLKSMNLVKYWSGEDTICVTPLAVQQLANSKNCKRPKLILDGNNIKWTPKTYFPQPGSSRDSRPKYIPG